MSNKVINLRLWDVLDFFWGTVVKEHRTGKCHKVFLKPDGQEIDVENLPVLIHENGIEFL